MGMRGGSLRGKAKSWARIQGRSWTVIESEGILKKRKVNKKSYHVKKMSGEILVSA